MVRSPLTTPALSASLVASLLYSTAGFSASSEPPNFAPNPGVGWIGVQTEFTPPASGTGPVTQDPTMPRITNDDFRRTGKQPTPAVADANSPILQPWVSDTLRSYNALVLADKAGLSPQASCRPTGVPAFDLHVVQPIYVIQTPEKVVMVWQADHEVRHIYLTGKHSSAVKPSWNGESIGHYEGDTLVVDTVGISTKTYVDSFHTPHSEKLHVVERFRMTGGGKVMEVKVHVEDPGAFTKPWDAVQHWRRVEPGVAENTVAPSAVSSSVDAGPMIEMSCAETPFTPLGEPSPVPQDDTPDF